MPCVCRLGLKYQGVNSDNAGGIRSQLKTVTPNNSTLKIDATQIIKDMENLKENAKNLAGYRQCSCSSS